MGNGNQVEPFGLHEHLNNRYNWYFWGAAIGVVFLFLSIVYYVFYSGAVSSIPINIYLYHLPLFIAPAITFAVAFLTCLNQLNEDTATKPVKLVNIIALAVTLLYAFFVSSPVLSPLQSLLLTFLLFLFFLIWDSFMIRSLKNKPNAKPFVNKIKTSRRLINVPAVVGYGAILLLVYLHPIDGIDHPFVAALSELIESVELSSSFQFNLGHEETQKVIAASETELFVSGSIAFHLVVTAVAFGLHISKS